MPPSDAPQRIEPPVRIASSSTAASIELLPQPTGPATIRSSPALRDFAARMCGLGVGIFAVDDDAWQTHRKVASHLFSGKQLKSKMEKVLIGSKRLQIELGRKAKQNTDSERRQNELGSKVDRIQ